MARPMLAYYKLTIADRAYRPLFRRSSVRLVVVIVSRELATTSYPFGIQRSSRKPTPVDSLADRLMDANSNEYH